MFQLFYSVFGGAGRPRGRWSESVIAAAIEHAVEGTVPRLRFLRGYRKRLRASVIHAMEHTAMLAAGIPGPLPMGPTAYRTEPRLTTVFATAAEMLDLFGGSAVASGLCHSRHGTDGRVTVLLLAERSDKHILGIDLVGDQLRREVKQTVVNFSRQRLRDPAASEDQARERIAWRAFEHVLGLARMRIIERRIACEDTRRVSAPLPHRAGMQVAERVETRAAPASAAGAVSDHAG